MIQKPQFTIPTLTRFLQYKFSADKNNTTYRTGSLDGTIRQGEPDIMWQTVVFIKDAGNGSGLIWTMGAPFAYSLTSAQIVLIASLFNDGDTAATLTDLVSRVARLNTDKQDLLVSGQNIKTINGQSIVGSGNIIIEGSGGGGGGTVSIDSSMSDTSTNAVQNKVIKQYVDNAVGTSTTLIADNYENVPSDFSSYQSIVVKDSGITAVILPISNSTDTKGIIYQYEAGYRVVDVNYNIVGKQWSEALAYFDNHSTPLTDIENKSPKMDCSVSTPTTMEIDDENGDAMITFYPASQSSAGVMTAAMFAKLNEAYDAASYCNNLISKTYSELKALRDGGQLVAGQQYRITDYVTTTSMRKTQSAGHAFDVIVVADSASTLSEDARAILHSGDTYFTNYNLNAWELKYCLDNDTARFGWADTTNGKGVIYRMKDDMGNDVSYDFKNIQFLVNDSYVYTFGGTEDKSLVNCRHNVIKEYYIASGYITLNWNTFGAKCYFNYIGKDNYGNTFGESCLYNILGEGCKANSFGSSSQYNTFGNGSSFNVLGESNSYNSLGNGCLYNIFGNSTGAKNDYQNITLENGVKYTYIDRTQASGSGALQNVHICSGVQGTGSSSSSRKTIAVPTLKNTYLTYVYMNESGELTYEKSGEVLKKASDLETNKADKSTTYTKSEVDSKLATKVDNVDGKSLIDALVAGLLSVRSDGYMLCDGNMRVEGEIVDQDDNILSDKADKSYVDGKIGEITEIIGTIDGLLDTLLGE